MCRAPLRFVGEDSDFESDDSHIDEANYAMLAAAEEGYEDIVRLMLSRGTNNYNDVMLVSAEAGYESLSRLMLYQDANNYNWAIGIAAFMVVRLL